MNLEERVLAASRRAIEKGCNPVEIGMFIAIMQQEGILDNKKILLGMASEINDMVSEINDMLKPDIKVNINRTYKF